MRKVQSQMLGFVALVGFLFFLPLTQADSHKSVKKGRAPASISLNQLGSTHLKNALQRAYNHVPYSLLVPGVSEVSYIRIFDQKFYPQDANKEDNRYMKIMEYPVSFPQLIPTFP